MTIKQNRLFYCIVFYSLKASNAQTVHGRLLFWSLWHVYHFAISSNSGCAHSLKNAPKVSRSFVTAPPSGVSEHVHKCLRTKLGTSSFSRVMPAVPQHHRGAWTKVTCSNPGWQGAQGLGGDNFSFPHQCTSCDVQNMQNSGKWPGAGWDESRFSQEY